jgi:ABC-2 type transport system permease protein
MSRSFKQFWSFFTSSFKSQLRTPAAWIWGFVFPVIFIVLFGFISNNPDITVKLGIVNNDLELTSVFRQQFANVNKMTGRDTYQIVESNRKNLENELQDGTLDAFLEVYDTNKVKLYTNANRPNNVNVIQTALREIDAELTITKNNIIDRAFVVEQDTINSREVRYLDFVLPGILGYSLLSSAVFGVAYSFLSLRQSNVLKRLFAAPTKSAAFILGQSLSRFIFIFAQTLIQLVLAMLIFDFKVNNGLFGMLQVIFVMALGLFLFLGIGYIVAGIGKTDDTVAPVANLIVFPQFILAGTFFPVENLPSEWLKVIVRVMPLYNFNEALRYLAIDGLFFWNAKVLIEIASLVIWCFVIYFIASKVFKVKAD